MTKIKEFTVDYQLLGGDCDAQGRMPMSLIAHQLIDIATLHANHLGIGFADLFPQGKAWVLSRLSIEVERYPRINERYSITTWVSSINRRFSERDFRLTDADGKVFAHGRSVWVTINLADRTLGDLSGADGLRDVLLEGFHAPIQPFPRLGGAPTQPDASYPYTFTYTDLDTNRHVNSVVYLRLMTNCRDLSYYDDHSMKRVDIAFMHEALYGRTALVQRFSRDATHDEILITGDDVAHARILVTWAG